MTFLSPQISSQLNTGEILWIVLAASILTLFVDYPFGNLKKLIFDGKKRSVVKSKTVLDENQNFVSTPKTQKIE